MKYILLFIVILSIALIPAALADPIQDAIRAHDITALKQSLQTSKQNIHKREIPGGPTPLMLAVADPKTPVEIINLLIASGADIEARDNDGRTPLMWAVWKGNATSTRVLIKHSARLEARDNKQLTPLLWASQGDNKETLAALIEAGAQINAVNQYGLTALSYAAEAGNIPQARILLDAGLVIHGQTEDGEKILDRAVRSGSPAMVQFFIDRGVNVNFINDFGKNILTSAVSSPNPQIINLLIKAGLNPLKKSVHSNQTAIEYALSQYSINPDSVQVLLQSFDNIDQYILDNALAETVKHASSNLTNVLLNAGADPTAEVSNYLYDDEDVQSDNLHSILRIAASSEIKTWQQNVEIIAPAMCNKFAQVPLENGILYQNDQITRLMVECAGGTTQTVQTLLEKHANIHATDSYGWSALQWAACNMKNANKIIPLLCDHGALEGEYKADGSAAIAMAARMDNAPAISALLDNGVDIESICSKGGSTPLSIAADEGGPNAVEVLIERSADLEHQQQYYGTPLLLAAAGGLDGQTIRLLVKAGAQLEVRDSMRGRTPLLSAAAASYEYHGSSPIDRMKTLLELGADPNAVDNYDNNAILSIAKNVDGGNRVMLMIKAGINVNLANSQGRTPLHHTALYYSAESVQALIDAGANVNASDNRGRTPLMDACSDVNFAACDLAHVEVLLKAGADPNAIGDAGALPLRRFPSRGGRKGQPEKTGRSVLHEAANFADPGRIKALIDAGAEVNRIDSQGATPLILAITEEKIENALELLRNGADPNLGTNKEGRSPLIIASAFLSAELVEAILNAGADIKAVDNFGLTALDCANGRPADDPDKTKIIKLLRAAKNK